MTLKRYISILQQFSSCELSNEKWTSKYHLCLLETFDVKILEWTILQLIFQDSTFGALKCRRCLSKHPHYDSFVKKSEVEESIRRYILARRNKEIQWFCRTLNRKCSYVKKAYVWLLVVCMTKQSATVAMMTICWPIRTQIWVTVIFAMVAEC